MDNAEVTKEKLELEKLKFEVRYMKKSFLIQSINSIGVLLLGALVFAAFQIPQIGIMADTKDENERSHIATIIMDIQKNKVPPEHKIELLETVNTIWPGRDFVISILDSAKSTQLVKELTSDLASMMVSEHYKSCQILSRTITDMEKTSKQLEAQMSKEASGVDGKASRKGAVWYSLYIQFLQNNVSLDALRYGAQTKKC